MAYTLVIFKWVIHWQWKKIQWGKFSGTEQVPVATDWAENVLLILISTRLMFDGCGQYVYKLKRETGSNNAKQMYAHKISI
jgi:hypothetical protein